MKILTEIAKIVRSLVLHRQPQKNEVKYRAITSDIRSKEISDFIIHIEKEDIYVLDGKEKLR